MKIVATWEQGRGPDTEGPTSIVWENGAPASVEDYRRHELDTHFWVENDHCEMERHMFPDIVADVAFDSTVRDWVVTGQGVVPGALDVKDPTEDPARDVITIAHGYEECYDRLNTLYFDTPMMSIEGSNWGERRFVVIIERSQWLSHEPGFCVEAGRIIEDSQEDLDSSFYPIQNALIKRLRSQGY